MANICSNVSAIIGPHEDLVDIRDKVNGVLAKGFVGLICVLEEYGFTKEEINGAYHRGDLEGEAEIKDEGTPNEHLLIWYQSAWSPCNETWELIIESKYPRCAHYYLAEECGCEVYVNTDPTGRYFPETFYLDGYDETTGSCLPDFDGCSAVNEGDALRLINGWLRMNGHEVAFESVGDAQEYVDTLGECSYIMIHEYASC